MKIENVGDDLFPLITLEKIESCGNQVTSLKYKYDRKDKKFKQHFSVSTSWKEASPAQQKAANYSRSRDEEYERDQTDSQLYAFESPTPGGYGVNIPGRANARAYEEQLKADKSLNGLRVMDAAIAVLGALAGKAAKARARAVPPPSPPPGRASAASGAPSNSGRKPDLQISGSNAGKGRKAPFNPTNSRNNCVACTAAFLQSVHERSLVEASGRFAVNNGAIRTANEHIMGITGFTLGRQQLNTLATLNARQFFVVYRGASTQLSDHVVIGINNGGSTMIYDPQSGTKYFDLGKFGPFTAFPVHFPQSQ